MNQFQQFCKNKIIENMSEQNNEKDCAILKKEIYDLIDGDFKCEDASEIINDLFFWKINFHSRKNFSQQIRFGSEDLRGVKRIDQLKMARSRAIELIEKSKINGKILRIKSTITLELI